MVDFRRQPVINSQAGASTIKDMQKLLILVMLVSGGGFAQPRPAAKKAAPAPAKWPIESLVVEGLHTYTREQVLAVAGLKIGQVAGKPEFEAARDKLVACGAFARPMRWEAPPARISPARLT